VFPGNQEPQLFSNAAVAVAEIAFTWFLGGREGIIVATMEEKKC